MTGVGCLIIEKLILNETNLGVAQALFVLLNISLSRARATIIIFTNEKRH